MSTGLHNTGPDGCGSTCLVCRDGRQGLRVDISGCLPTVGTWTSHIDGVEDTFEILSVDWAIDTDDPIFFGQEINGSGHIMRQCCERWVGSLVAEWVNPDYGIPLIELFYITVEIVGAGEVAMRFFSYNYNNLIEFFRWYRPLTGPSGSEYPLCSIKRNAWTTLGNTQLADYDPARVYITEADGYEVQVIPTYGNDDGAYLHPGTGNNAQNADDIADPSACQSCSIVEDLKITISGMSSLCIDSLVRPGADTGELPFTITGGILYLDPASPPNPTADNLGAGVNCSGDPAYACFDPSNVTTSEVDAYFSFFDEGRFKVTVIVTVFCEYMAPGGPGSGVSCSGDAYFDVTCSGGIVSDSQTVTMSGGAGTITVDLVPA